MKAIAELARKHCAGRPLVLAAGFFDGVHLGHQAVIARAQEAAQRIDGTVGILTLEPHPLKVLLPERAPILLTSLTHKEHLLKRYGVDAVFALDFTRELSAMEPEEFIAKLKRQLTMLQCISVGANWTFGRRAAGNVGTLRKLGKTYHFDVEVVEHVLYGNEPASSTRVRAAIQEGRLEDAAAMLGRPFSLLGSVVHGRKVGRTLGYPTANIEPHNEVRPLSGIYAAFALIGGVRYKAAAYIGHRPTFDDCDDWVLEVFLLDADIELYDRLMEVELIHFLRPDQSFPDPESLRAQIARDIMAVRESLDKS